MEIVLQNAHARAVIPKKGFRKGSVSVWVQGRARARAQCVRSTNWRTVKNAVKPIIMLKELRKIETCSWIEARCQVQNMKKRTENKKGKAGKE